MRDGHPAAHVRPAESSRFPRPTTGIYRWYQDGCRTDGMTQDRSTASDKDLSSGISTPGELAAQLRL